MPITESASGGSDALTANWFLHMASLLKDGGILVMPALACSYQVWESRRAIRLTAGPRSMRFENIVRRIGWTVEE